jgi:hypothetical protein
MPLDIIHAWQNSITSAPTSTAAVGSTSASDSTVTTALPPPADIITVQKVSLSRGVGSRLAWIRALEDKKQSSTNGDLSILNKKAGSSVSDKLAMFENKKLQSASPAQRLQPLARTNSTTTSRLSWVDSTSSANGNIPASSRTSIDTIRSSYRASSVMNYYDESFREKLESVVDKQATNNGNADLEENKEIKT